MLELQNVLGYSALKAGASLLPVNAMMLPSRHYAGRLARRIGARLPMMCGALIAAVGWMRLHSRHPPGAYVTSVLPAIIVFGLGLSIFVAAVDVGGVVAVPSERVALHSAVNNACRDWRVCSRQPSFPPCGRQSPAANSASTRATLAQGFSAECGSKRRVVCDGSARRAV
jgi:hypothetical protein